MDFNDIDSRLKRLYLSIGDVFIEDHADLVSFNEERESGSDAYAIKVDFGPTNQHDADRRIEAVISMLARMKDTLKKRMNSLGLEQSLVEKEINDNPVLQFVIDLDNQFKHGYPLERVGELCLVVSLNSL